MGSSTTATTTVYHCAAPSKVYPIDDDSDCNEPIAPGGSCQVKTKEHECLEQTTLLFECPDLNDVKGYVPEPALPPGGEADHLEWRTRCKVCDLDPVVFVDEYVEESLVGPINFGFGPNSLNGKVDELDIEHYEVRFA